jgi:hypothetical protein
MCLRAHRHRGEQTEREREKADGNTGLVIKLEPTLSCVRVSRNYYLQISGEERERRLWFMVLAPAEIHEHIGSAAGQGIMRHSIPNCRQGVKFFMYNLIE